MEISVKWFEGKYPSFNVMLSSKPGNDPFLEIKGCRIVSGSKGEFVSPPSTKNKETEKYWNHCYFSDDFAKVILEKAKSCQPQQSSPAKAPETKVGFMDIDSDIPFAPHGKCGAGVSWRAM